MCIPREPVAACSRSALSQRRCHPERSEGSIHFLSLCRPAELPVESTRVAKQLACRRKERAQIPRFAQDDSFRGCKLRTANYELRTSSSGSERCDRTEGRARLARRARCKHRLDTAEEHHAVERFVALATKNKGRSRRPPYDPTDGSLVLLAAFFRAALL